MTETIDCGGQNMPIVGLGTWEATDESELEMALNAALEMGYRHIDTAAAYGNENVVGRVINEWISTGKLTRDEIFLVTKLPMRGIHRDRVEKYITNSLEKLGLDYIDLYLIHFPVGLVENTETVEYEKPDHEGVWQSMENQVDAGRAKSIGLSNFNVEQIENILKFARIKPACNQIELHVFLQQPELVAFCQENGIVVTAYSPLGSPGYNKFLRRIGQEEKTNLVDVFTDPVISVIASKHGKTNAQVALKFLLHKNVVIIPKSVSPSRLKSNFDLFDFTLDDEDIEQLEQLNIGEDGRVIDWKIFPMIDEQPEYPFSKK